MVSRRCDKNSEYHFLSLQPRKSEDRKDFMKYRCDDIEEMYAIYLFIALFSVLGYVIMQKSTAAIPAIILTVFNFTMRVVFFVLRKRFGKAFIYHIPVFHALSSIRYIIVAYTISFHASDPE